ncbi:uncharacterized protein F4817DRAFT_361105 [Daldinia loculata]|uniref:uncharacterized protein n=1 Tax=Daldinia loculata TaxID=103429 RepID=UPI0020C3E862|nr:uncharacterized protein F4817DRAFT_361105 [Daldinia loculata]KAI1643982.1 hypothetical protein F4817DRAFT_361105 [Daldinia loculata]
MSDPSPGAINANIFGAFGAVLGYIGAEAATPVTFERLLWPQRNFSNFKWGSIVTMALFMPMGGPTHKVALSVLDKMFLHGLFKGPGLGHMLGTSFFPEQHWMYTMHGDSGEHKAHTEPLRNCIWARALSQIPMLEIENPKTSTSPGQIEKGNIPNTQVLRARVAVNHLRISGALQGDRHSDLPFVWEDTKSPCPKVFLAIITTEMTGIILALCVSVIYHSPWALLWLLPLFLRLVSAFFAIHREQLLSTHSSASDDPPCDFVIHCPQSEGNFMLISGPPALVLQFFRHYGHPERQRMREVVQILCIILFACEFPIALLSSMIWMPVEIQYIWLTHQLYVVIVIHISRYLYIGQSATTEAKIAQAFTKQVKGKQTYPTVREASILFGHERHGSQTLKVDLMVTYHQRNKEGRERLEELLRLGK